MVVIYIISFLVILIMANYYRQKKNASEIRAEHRKTREAEVKHLNLEKNVLCEDGITRVYQNKMYGILKNELIVINGHPVPKGGVSSIPQLEEARQRMLKLSNQVLKYADGAYAITGDILSKLTLHFNIHSIQIRVAERYSPRSKNGSNLNQIFSVNFTKSQWFSEDGTILSQEEIINSAKYYRRKRWEENQKMGIKISLGAGVLMFNEINGFYFVSGPHFGELRLFNGRINEIEFVKGEPKEDIQVQTPPSVNKDVVTEQYSLNDGLPPVLDSEAPDSKLFKRDMSGLIQYFKEMPNMERIYNEFSHAIRNGYTVENYLSEANLMDDAEIREIAGKGFSIIVGFLTDMLKIQENKEVRKDLEACKKAVIILLNPQDT